MKRNDVIIVLCLLFVIGVILLINHFKAQETGDLFVEVRINKDVVDTFPLDENRVELYNSDYGFNELTIIDGTVTVSDADCRDHICVDTKDGKNSGDAIVCVPNRFTVEIIGGGSEIDVIAQ